MSERMLTGATHITEFVPRSTGGKWNGTCGETSLAVAMSILDETPCTPARIDSIASQMTKLRMTFADNGATNIENLAKFARLQGYKTVFEKDYTSDNWNNDEWRIKLQVYAGILPIVLNIADGRFLVDALTGSKDESKLEYHVICVVGKSKQGYICCDGDNPQANERYQTYTFATLDTANPCGMIVLDK